MAEFKKRHLDNIGSGQQENVDAPAGESCQNDTAARLGAKPAESNLERSHAVTALLCFASLALFGVLACNSGGSNSSSEKSTQGTPAVSPPSATSAPKLSASELKEVQARDDYADKLSKALHAKMPAYKNVNIYADSWAGNKAPKHGPLTDIKARTGDNLMLVFWSPDASTARGLTDFTKSRAAQDAVNAGFAEFQFVDSGTYCYAQVAPVAGVGPISCGIR